MPTLFLLRHAKSSWADASLADRDRPLAPRGQRAARRLAKHLKSQAIRPPLVLCSPARRARETLELVLPAMGKRVELNIEEDLYGADADELLDRLRRVPPGVDSVLLIGHNPGLHDLASELSGDGESDAIDQLRVNLPTGALATLDLGHTGWAQLAPGSAYLAGLVVPRAMPEDR